MTYTLKDLVKDLKRLDKKADALDSLKVEYDDLANIVVPVYLAKRIELFAKYFNVKVGKSNGFEPLENDEEKER
jgi:hypothetical protein